MSRATVTALLPGLTLAFLAGSGCAPGAEHRLEGRTMGTTYHVTVVSREHPPRKDLQEAVDRRLDEVNRQLSTWLEDSEVSRFNRFGAVGEEFPISGDFLRVMRAAAEIHALSDGAWDGTVNPLVVLWGFGPGGPALSPPSEERIARALGGVGFDKIEINPAGALVKRHAAVTVDLSSIAKGYGVDAVVEVLRGAGEAAFLVEIGGEVFAAGRRRDGRPWRVGINRPDPEAGPEEVYKVVPLGGQALATSGDYRSYVLEEGRRRSHVIDPRTGQPVTNGVVSATVLAPTCMMADGLATAVMVMGPQKGLALIERLDEVEALIVVERRGGFFEEHASSGFRTEGAPGR
ncbi:MAG: FAD:protein FMN transferase [Acidobacteria bacterium]|jgi:thiamine biosynthesis lipoprotein|nr:FAD:protein FMN transferase [Acidobacteriota bacterium]